MNLALLSAVGYPGNEYLDDGGASRAQCPANIFSPTAIKEMVYDMIDKGFLREDRMVTVSTGGGIGGVRWPNRKVFVTNLSSNPPQMNFSYKKKGDPTGFKSKPYPGQEEMKLSTKFNLSHILLRYYELDGAPFPVGVEASHRGERDKRLIPDRNAGANVELLTAERPEANESRKTCALFASMWRKADGSLIPEAEKDTYTGHTRCPHAAFGSPCYGHYPTGPAVVVDAAFLYQRATE
ncbi:hypothetical protein DFJ74DRAFT_705011 [Hyaloraphidium curvatum]|nr:hypothetical protein DFJ74DRAFT_705011 [Hyaloraphidium curvatum]